MKKIMFNDRYGLTDAVLQGRKTMTRRIIHHPSTFQGEEVTGFHIYRRKSDGQICEWPVMHDADEREIADAYILPAYKVGEVVAVAQNYEQIYEQTQVPWDYRYGEAGWNNKMFVRADLMEHQIRITNIRIERLQDISDEDCLREGVMQSVKKDHYYFYDEKVKEGRRCFWTPREAFATLIDNVSGRGTWQRNPWVFVCEFELVK